MFYIYIYIYIYICIYKTHVKSLLETPAYQLRAQYPISNAFFFKSLRHRASESLVREVETLYQV